MALPRESPKPKTPTPSDASKRAARISAGTLVIVDRKGKASLSRAVDDAVAVGIVQASRERSDRRKKLAALTALLWIAKDMEVRLTKAIVDARQEARRQAQKRLSAEVRAAGVRVPIPVSPASAAARIGVDQHQASSSAASLAAQWRGRATAEVLKASRTEGDVADAIERVTAALDPSIERTAITEVAQAWNDEKVEAIEEAIEEDEELADAIAILGGGIVRRWDAILDRRTCAECSAHDGEIAPIGGRFTGGDEPGFLHSRCRCIDTIVAI